jgi:8-oxo-dGTP diphosphatase
MPNSTTATDPTIEIPPIVAVLVGIFTVVEGEFQVLLIQRSAAPDEGKWAIPGGGLQPDESLDHAATRKLAEETGVTDVFLEQLYTFGDLDDQTSRGSVAVVYFALVDHDRVRLPERTAWQPDWFGMGDLPVLALHNERVLDVARQRIINKLQYTNAAYSLLPDFFSLTDLQSVYESILGRRLDKRNFRRRMLASDLLVETKQTATTGRHRPARLYRFAARQPVEF